MMKRQITTALFAVLLLIPAMVQAHAGHHHKTVMGTVRAINASHIDVTTKDGKNVAVPLAKDTMFMRGDEMGAVADVKAGTRVVIELGEDGKTAEHVKMAAAPKKK